MDFPMRFRLWMLLLLLGACGPITAQLDTIHWLAPMYGSVYTGDQYIELTTPEAFPFKVTLQTGSGSALTTFSLSRSQPVRYKLASDYSQLLVPDNVLQQVLSASGIVVHGPKAFHAAFRFYSDTDQYATYMPCKGRAALGTVFRIGHTWQVTDKTGARNNFIGVLATEDNTVITLSGYNPALEEFPGGAPVTYTLNKGESIVFKHYVGGIEDDEPRNGFMGALLTATKPVSVTSGSWLGAPVIYLGGNDICLDQLLPLEQMGKDYILCMGNGPAEMERVIVIAHEPNTRLWLNGHTNPDTLLQPGQFAIFSTAHYIPRGNMYVRSSEPVFVFQMIGGVKTGSAQLANGSFMVVPPIQCGLPNRLDYVLLPNRLNSTRFGGGLMVVAQRGASVAAWVDGSSRPLGDPTDVPGNPDFVTYRAMNFFGTGRTDSTLRVESSGAIQVSLVVRNKNIGYAALFSGPVIRKPFAQLGIVGDGICPDTLQANGDFAGLQWYYEDSLFQEGPDRHFVLSAPGTYKTISYLQGCPHTALVLDSIQVPLNAPTFLYSIQEPSCFGFSDGQISMGAPDGGAAPYRYSIDFGQHFFSTPDFNGLRAGGYKLVVEDAIGCYNQPVRVDLKQPDSLGVQLYFKQLPKPLRPGEEVVVKASVTGAPFSSTDWYPDVLDTCEQCLEYTFNPEKTVWVRLTVYDQGGCPSTDSLLVLVTPPVYAPNVFRAGSDDLNGRFTLYSEKPLLIKQLLIYDRWGELLFENQDFYTNDPAQGWSGQSTRRLAQAGVYVFTAQVEVEPGRIESVRGDITLLR